MSAALHSNVWRQTPGHGSASYAIDNAGFGTSSKASTDTVTKEPLKDNQGQVTGDVTTVIPITDDDDEAVTKFTTGNSTPLISSLSLMV